MVIQLLLLRLSQLVTEKTYNRFITHLLKNKRMKSCYAFENEKFLFPAAHHSTRFILLTLGPEFDFIECATAIWNVNWLKENNRIYKLTFDDIKLLNPDTKSIPQFRTKQDGEITSKIYHNDPLLRSKNRFRGEVSVSRVMHDKDDAAVISWNRKNLKLRKSFQSLSLNFLSSITIVMQHMTMSHMKILKKVILEIFPNRSFTIQNLKSYQGNGFLKKTHQ